MSKSVMDVAIRLDDEVPEGVAASHRLLPSLPSGRMCGGVHQEPYGENGPLGLQLADWLQEMPIDQMEEAHFSCKKAARCRG
jgi:hypothetical protein